MVPPLPTAIDVVTVPERFTPSGWYQMEACPVSVWAQGEAALPPSVRTVVGRVLHAAREAVIKQDLTGPLNTQRVRETIEVLRAQEERQMADSGEPLDVPLDVAFGTRRWLQRVLWLEAWARALPLSRPGVHAPASAETPKGGAVGDTFGTGAEPTWSVRALRLRGRPDEAQVDQHGDVAIIDYKTGYVGRAGRLPPRIETQLQLYVLMARELTGRNAHAVVAGADFYDVPWNPEVGAKLRDRVLEFGDRFPDGATIPATSASTPGAHCVGCGLRPRCGTYLRQVARWWPNTGEHPRPLPTDAWGIVMEARVEQIGLRVRLRHVQGQITVVRGLDPRWHAEVPEGTQLFLFDLEATEDTALHGRRLHPHAMHERSPGPRWPRAFRTRAFIGAGRWG